MKIPKSKHHGNNVARSNGGYMPCVVCGKPIKDPSYYVECVNGGTDECVLPGQADVDDPGYMGYQPLGANCLLAHPELGPYVSKA